MELSRVWGLERLGFLTLTFPEYLSDPVEAQRKFHSLKTHVLTPRYPAWIRVFERHKSARIHYHLLVVLPGDIRTGFCFEEIAERNYTSANGTLRKEWAFWRKEAPDYGFGRTELLPIKSTGKAVAEYVGKYIGKSIEVRQKRDKGIRLVSYSQGTAVNVTRFDWASAGKDNWRRKLAKLGTALGYTSDSYSAGFLHDFGSKWPMKLRAIISQIRFSFYRTGKHYLSDYPLDPAEIPFDQPVSLPPDEERRTFTVALLMALQLRAEHWDLQKNPRISNSKSARLHRSLDTDEWLHDAHDTQGI